MVCNKDVQTLIVCVGNEQVCDDGIGARVGRILQSLPLPPDVAVLSLERIGIGLLDALAGAAHVVVVDALATEGEPGASTVADVTELHPATVGSGCAHRATVTEIVTLARQVWSGEAFPAMTLAGIERKQSLAIGEGFSSEVLAAVPRMVDLLLLTVGARLEARTMVKQVCRHFVVPADGAFAYVPGEEPRAEAVAPVWQ
jgi:hydrogenase maturation protease